MKTVFFSLLLAFVVNSISFAQTAIIVEEGQTLRVMCWGGPGTGPFHSLDTGCDINLNGDRFGNNADTVIVRGAYFWMEMGNADPQYIYYEWSDFTTDHTKKIEPDWFYPLVEWGCSKLSTTTGYGYVGTFWVRFDSDISNTIVSAENEWQSAQAYDISGRQISTSGKTLAQVRENLPRSGVYVVVTQTSQGPKSFKIVKWLIFLCAGVLLGIPVFLSQRRGWVWFEWNI